MQNNQSSYARWSWIVALILALILIWMYFTGRGPSGSCCTNAEVVVPIAETVPAENTPTVTEAFHFSATEYDFLSTGDASNITWAGEDIDALKALLNSGIKAEGNETAVTLTGTADSNEAKAQIGLNAQAFFGQDVTIDNQVTVIVAEPTDMPPSTAKLYFDSGFHRLPTNGQSVLEPVITWLKTHPETKAIISGFHDVTGDLASNQKLAKKRAQSTFDALIAGGVSADSIEMRKPESTKGDGDLSEARRVEVSIE